MRIFLVLLAALLASCSYIPGITPYKIDVQQGNVVTQEMVSKLRPGLTKSQVQFILGTPLIRDPFHPERWDYVYVLEKQGKLKEQRKFTVVFDDDKLARVEGDVVPAKAAGDEASTIAPAAEDNARGTAAPAGGN